MRGRVAASSELDRLEKQLSDWVNCASAKTSAGRAKIAEISGKIGAVKARSEHVESDAALTSANANANAKAKAQGTTMILDSPRQREGLGNTLDVFA